MDDVFAEVPSASSAPPLQRTMSSFSLGSRNSKGTQVSDSDSASVTTGNTETSRSEKWGYLFKDQEKEPEFNALDSGVLQSGERKISVSPEGIETLPRELNKVKAGKPNTLRTTRFTFVTWIPLSLMHQFKRVANIYFLFICVIVCFPWSPKTWHSKLGPFVLVLLWTACKDMYEDLRRRRDDRAENSQAVRRLVKGKNGLKDRFEEVTWKDSGEDKKVPIPRHPWEVRHPWDATGEFRRPRTGPSLDAGPAAVRLHRRMTAAHCFISTVMLDGETSLKERSAPSVFEALSRECGKKSQNWLAMQAENDAGAPARKSGQKTELARTKSMDNAEDEAGRSWKEMEPEFHKYFSTMCQVGLDIKLAAPTPTLQDVRGGIHMRSKDAASGATAVCPFGEINFLPRGCVLRNTPWVLGIAAYVGDDSKCRLNAMQGRVNKFSNMQVNLNNVIVGLLGFLLALCSAATIVFVAGEGTLAEPTGEHPIIMFFNLYVVYEMLKLLLGYLLASDKQMVDPDTGEGALPRTADLMEEMGQISFIFSDKTGTLTRNEMVFAECDIGGTDMGEFRGNDAPGLQKVKQVFGDGEEGEAGHASTATSPTFHNMVDFFTCLAVCHSVVRERQADCKQSAEPNGAGNSSVKPTALYSGASPDEVALVDAACNAGIEFKGRKRRYAGSSSELIVRGPGSKERVFVQLFELPFSSDRKRMSVIVRHKGDIWCITKGADSVMEGLLREPLSADSQTHLNTYAAKGLRTLIIGMKKVSQEEWEEWSADYITAREVINTTKESGMAAVAARIEKGLKFVGITAVDDRLQDQVQETISLVKEMGIRLWVLTGDKTETAVDIARSCSLFTSSTTLAYAVKGSSAKDAEDRLLKAYSELEGKADAGIVLDGQTLLHALKSPECRKVIYDLGMVSRSCICARLSPQQKLQLVQLVREQDPKTITLSVGDGANDVPMIYGAHVGIAIRGKEGTQAMQASDIAISQFRFLMPLLQCHGRRAYRRVAMFLCFFLYKNITLIMLDIVWMFQYKFKGLIAVPEWLSINFNPIFTSLHMLLILALDKDISDEQANKNPALYKVGPARKLFNVKVFSKWVILACYHGVVCWTIPYTILDPDIDNVVKTEPSDFWVSSVTSFSCVVFVVCLKLMLVAQNPLGLHTWLPTLITFVMFFIVIFCFSYVWFGPTMQPNMKGMFGDMIGNSKVYMSVAAVCLVALTPDVIMLVTEKLFFPSDLDKARRRSRQLSSPEQ
ncbi:unnamed protein product [Prorocentrum cordatum]|uniref:Phospholipid-transporting ATPase n=1 Tax=Prorocentrum cordatum TaxID=2364126 RepID=A0ABN9WRS5_9DINO|nr:unnamed protein product [Polarella glacialis]